MAHVDERTPGPTAEAATRLAELRSSLLGQIRSFEAAAESLVSSRADGGTHFDPGSNEGDPISIEVEQLRRLEAQARAELADLSAALSRVGAGTYGRCEGCGQDIAPARLEAVPAASECVPCKSRRQR